MKRTLLVYALVALVGCAKSADMAPVPAPVTEPAKVEAPKVSQEQIMAMMKELATPGVEHKALKPLVGNWKTETKFWMKPGEKPSISKGKAKHSWILGDRFVQQNFTGTWDGKPFTGTGMLGYDKAKKEYVSVWLDTMGTGIMSSNGTFDAEKKELTMFTTFQCPVAKAEKKVKMVTKILSDKSHVFSFYDTAPDGTEYTTMEITYTRIK